MVEKINKIKCVIRCFIRSLSEKRVSTFAAASSFKFFLSLPALTAVVCAALPYTSFTKDEILTNAAEVLPVPVYEVGVFVIESAYKSSTLIFSLSAFIALYSASSAICTIASGINMAFGLQRNEGFLRFRFRGIGNLLFVLTALFVHMAAALLVPKSIREMITFLALIVTIMAVYCLFPSNKQRFKTQFPGAFLATVAAVLFSKAFAIYFVYMEPYGIFGVLGTVLASMLWLYWCAYFLLMGACMNNCINTTCKDCQKKRTSE